MSKKISRKKTKTVKVTCKECGRVIRVSKGSVCDRGKICYACLDTKTLFDVDQKDWVII